MTSPEEREEFEEMSLGYTETFGAPNLLESISSTCVNRKASEILCLAGASEGIFVANIGISDKDSHAIVVTPNEAQTDGRGLRHVTDTEHYLHKNYIKNHVRY